MSWNYFSRMECVENFWWMKNHHFRRVFTVWIFPHIPLKQNNSSISCSTVEDLQKISQLTGTIIGMLFMFFFNFYYWVTFFYCVCGEALLADIFFSVCYNIRESTGIICTPIECSERLCGNQKTVSSIRFYFWNALVTAPCQLGYFF